MLPPGGRARYGSCRDQMKEAREDGRWHGWRERQRQTQRETRLKDTETHIETEEQRQAQKDTEIVTQTNGWKETREPNDTVIERQRQSRNTKRHRHVRTEGLRDRDRMEKETQR